MNAATSNAPIEITSLALEEFLSPGSDAVLLDFWSPWCVPCMLMKRTVEKAATALEGVARVGLVNTDEQNELVERFDIRATPTMIVLRNGEPVARWTGISNANGLRRNVVQALQ